MTHAHVNPKLKRVYDNTSLTCVVILVVTIEQLTKNIHCITLTTTFQVNRINEQKYYPEKDFSDK